MSHRTASILNSDRNLRLNCRILALDGKILLIRPKIFLCNDGNYRFDVRSSRSNSLPLISVHREMRYFQPWPQGRVEDFILPRSMQRRQGSIKVPIGDAVLSMADVRFDLDFISTLSRDKLPGTGNVHSSRII